MEMALRKTDSSKRSRSPELEKLKADIDAGLADVAAGSFEVFDRTKIVEQGRQLLSTGSAP
jgi:antitoxin ParD1/3/4